MPCAPSSPESDREIVLHRDYAAPRELVFAAWRDPAVITRWWGPRGFRTTTHAMDFRSGGVWTFTMHGPDGRDYENRVRYLEIVPGERITYQHDGGEGDHDPVHFHTTATFEETAGGTRLTLRMVFPSAEERERVAREYGAVEGGRETLARLADVLAAGGVHTT